MTESPLGFDVISDLPGRLRLHHEGLASSDRLRRHCQSFLAANKHVSTFRINILASCLCITYTSVRSHEIHQLVRTMFSSRIKDETIGLNDDVQIVTRRIRNVVIHGVSCLALVAFEVAIPPVVLAGTTIVLLLPTIKEVLEAMKHRELAVESLELAFSGALISHGFASEALLDMAFNDAASLAQKVVDRIGDIDDPRHLLEVIGSTITVQRLYGSTGISESVPLNQLECNDIFLLKEDEYCFISAIIVSGEVVVENRLVDGDWRPFRLSAGQTISPGAYIIAGEAQVSVVRTLRQEPAFALIRQSHSVQSSKPGFAEDWLDIYNRIGTPFLLGSGSVLFSMGAVEQALAAFQFNPVNDWQASSLAANITAITDLKLMDVRVRDGESLMVLGEIDHLIISRSCLDRLGGVQFREAIDQESSIPKGELIKLLAGVQQWICENDLESIWSEQLIRVSNPIGVRHVQIHSLEEGWSVETDDDRYYSIKWTSQASDFSVIRHFDPIEIHDSSGRVGTVEIMTHPDGHWMETIRSLADLNVTVHVVGLDPTERMHEITAPLSIEDEFVHGCFDSQKRLDLIMNLQKDGHRVAYLGYVLNDLAALAQADVSLGLESDESSHFASRVCDISMFGDSTLLPRLLQISQSLAKARDQNFALLGLCQISASLLTAFELVSPLATILISDIPLLMAEVNNIRALRSSKQLHSC